MRYFADEAYRRRISLHLNIVESLPSLLRVLFFFFFNDTATTEIYTLSLHDALPIAKAATEDDPARTGEILGVTGHLAPELAKGDEVDGRADVYGLGACLFEMLTGRAPSVAAHGPSGPMGPRSLRAGVPRELDAVVTKAMARDPERRFPTARIMASALARSAAADDGDTQAIVHPPPELPREVPEEPDEGFMRHEGRWLGWALVLVGLAVVLVVVGQ